MKRQLSFSVLSLLLIFLASCSQTPTAQEVVDRAITASGTDLLKNAEVAFTFRDKQYEYQMTDGHFTYSRSQKDSTEAVILDVYTNEGISRKVNGELVTLSEKEQNGYSSSINSVIYFAFLPLWLNDEAVLKKYEGIKTIKGKDYHKIQVTFGQEGGGEDFDDVFYYWFDVDNYAMDYLAYSYHTNEGGMRFRQAYNTRDIHGVFIQDYHNLKPKEKGSIVFDQIDEAFEKGELVELSTIDLKEVKVSLK